MESNTLILIKKASELFDDNFQPLQSDKFKYLMLQTENQLKMLIMKEFHPFEYHAQALYSYMIEKNLNEIMVNGGGKIHFSLKDNTLAFNKMSYAFGQACFEEVFRFCKSTWPNLLIDTVGSIQPGMRKEMFAEGKVLSLKEVKYEADHP